MALFGSVMRSGLVRNSLAMARHATQKLEGAGLGHLKKFNCRRPGRFLLGGGVISASVTKEGIRAEEASAFDWSSQSTSAASLAKHYKEIDDAKLLARETLTCDVCGERLRIEGELPGVTYCQCPEAPKSVYGVEGPDGWRPFLERKDILVWRRKHPSMQGMYEYKMYGSFSDVTAEEFLYVQNDLSKFRLSWDNSTKQLTKVDEEENSVVYYWEINWPRFFSNRDYCCHRSVQVDPETGTVACISSSTEHPACKGSRGVVRVGNYRSALTVRAHTSPELPGTEFCLTGFEDPGVQLPEAIITWVAVRGMPEFMLALRAACLKLRKERENSPSWGRQEDNFGQIHQLRQQQQQQHAAYA